MSDNALALLFVACQRTLSLDVMDVYSLACDNAAATLGGHFVSGTFNDEFLSHWLGSLQSILADCDVSPAARAFFDEHSVAY